MTIDTTPGPPPLPCPVQEPAGNATTYYVAINEPGASNDDCDGLSPVDRGGGRCPFKDFQSERTFQLLQGVAKVRVEVRGGTYTFATEALTVEGSGASDADQVVLTAYGDEGVVFDGRRLLREVIRVAGQHATVERVTLQNAGAYNLEVRTGRNHRVQCNRFLANRASDSMKGDPGTGVTEVRYNDFSGWDSQAIDMTGVRDWVIEENVFHHPAGSRGNAIGAKFGSRGVVIARNLFKDTRGLNFGGTGSSHGNEFEAYELVAEGNRFENVSDHPVRFYSCSNCEFRDNDVSGAEAGIVLGGEERDGPSGCPGGCRPTQGAVVVGNRLRDLRGNLESPPDTFWGVNRSETEGLQASDNLYCVSSGGEASFFYGAERLPFDAWTTRLGTDSTSVVVSENDALCLGW